MLRGSLALTSLLFMCCIPEAETTAPPQASPAVIAVFATHFGYRAYSGFDFLIEVSQNKTAEFITATADAGINFIVPAGVAILVFVDVSPHLLRIPAQLEERSVDGVHATPP